MNKSILSHVFLISIAILTLIGFLALKATYERNLTNCEQSAKRIIHNLRVDSVKKSKLIENLELKVKFYRSRNLKY